MREGKIEKKINNKTRIIYYEPKSSNGRNFFLYRLSKRGLIREGTPKDVRDLLRLVNSNKYALFATSLSIEKLSEYPAFQKNSIRKRLELYEPNYFKD